jgi:27-O-demethylrifamycin SV methyltransferase
MLDPTTINSASHYDAVAEAWGYLLGRSLHYGYFVSGEEELEHATDQLTELMLEKVQKLGPGKHVLDVGCGTGAPAREIVRRYRCAVTGISPSSKCVTLACASTPSELRDSARFELGDAQDLRFDAETFDAAWVMESSHLMLDKPKLFSELARVVRPGGQLVLCDVVHINEVALKEVLGRRDEFLLLARVFGRALMRTPGYYAAQASRAGFTDVEVRDLTEPTAPTFDRWQANAVSHRDEVIRLIGPEAWSEFVEANDILRRLWSEGVLGYFLLSASREAPSDTQLAGQQA